MEMQTAPKENQVVNISDTPPPPPNAAATTTTHKRGNNINNKNNNNINMNKSRGATGMAFSALGSLIKLLPTGTVFVFQFASPIVTNSGECNHTNKILTAALLVICAFCCAFASFTDSYADPADDKVRHYGVVTAKGLWPSPGDGGGVDLSGYRLRIGDFVHAVLSLVVFAVLGLLDSNTVHCFYPGFESTQKQLLQVLPPLIGVVAGGVFMVFPNNRHGIGYPRPTNSNDDSPKSGGASA